MEAPPTLSEIERRRAEAQKLGEVGRLLEWLPTPQLAQMAVEPGHLHWVGRSQPGGSSNWPWEARLPERNSFRPVRWRSPKVPTRDGGSLWDLLISKKYWSPYLQVTLFTSSLCDSPWSRVIQYALPGACHVDSAGSWRGWLGSWKMPNYVSFTQNASPLCLKINSLLGISMENIFTIE